MNLLKLFNNGLSKNMRKANPCSGRDSSNTYRLRGERLHHHDDGVCNVLCAFCVGLVWLLSLVLCRQVPCDNPKIGFKALLSGPPRLAPHLLSGFIWVSSNNLDASSWIGSGRWPRRITSHPSWGGTRKKELSQIGTTGHFGLWCIPPFAMVLFCNHINSVPDLNCGMHVSEARRSRRQGWIIWVGVIF